MSTSSVKLSKEITEKILLEFNDFEDFEKTLKSFADESDFSLDAWIEALEFFFFYLRKKKARAEIKKMLGYLACCAQADLNLPLLPSLKELLKEMLAEHGYEAGDQPKEVL